MREADAQAILTRLREQQDAMAELLGRLARAESPSVEADSQAESYSILAGALEALGFGITRVPGARVGDHLQAAPGDMAPDARFQLLVGHLDTVWPLGTVERMPVAIEDGRLKGPGAYDMKGGLVQMLFALRMLRDQSLEPSVPPLVFVNSDEEIGSPESAAHIRRLAQQAVRALVLEPSFGPAGKLKTARKGVGRFTVRMKGRASHAGIDPERGVSAILEASHQIQRLFALNDHERGITVNVGTIDGGLRPNVVAPEVTAVVDARVLHDRDAHTVERAIRDLVPVEEGISIEVEGGFGRPPLERTPRNRALWDAARAAAGKLGIPIAEATVGGASDGNITSQYTATLDGLGPVGEGAHAPHEYVLLAQMPERAALLALLLMLPAEES
jgi:glutamate carboxypeptidase